MPFSHLIWWEREEVISFFNGGWIRGLVLIEMLFELKWMTEIQYTNVWLDCGDFYRRNTRPGLVCGEIHSLVVMLRLMHVVHIPLLFHFAAIYYVTLIFWLFCLLFSVYWRIGIRQLWVIAHLIVMYMYILYSLHQPFILEAYNVPTEAAAHIYAPDNMHITCTSTDM